jgi:hypothetical protein
MLKTTIAKVRSDPSIMDDPQTDKRPLVIGWQP